MERHQQQQHPPQLHYSTMMGAPACLTLCRTSPTRPSPSTLAWPPGWAPSTHSGGQMDRSGLGVYSHSFKIPVSLGSRELQRVEDRQEAAFMSSCYCIQRGGISITGVIME